MYLALDSIYNSSRAISTRQLRHLLDAGIDLIINNLFEAFFSERGINGRRGHRYSLAECPARSKPKGHNRSTPNQPTSKWRFFNIHGPVEV